MVPGLRHRPSLRSLAIVLGLAAAAFFTFSPGQSPGQAAPGSYVVLAWNDLGMHCYNNDFADLAVLPPYNTLWVQVVQTGDPPRIVTSGLTVKYGFPDNTTSAGKTNFWQYAQGLFGLAQPLPPDTGLTGKGLAGQMDVVGSHFVAAGIPLTEYSDSAPTVRSPYQLAQIVVLDSASGQEVARQAKVVAPTSSEMMCVNCHSQTGDASTRYPINPGPKVTQNILALHDYLSAAQYPAGHQGALLDRVTKQGQPVLCAECHSSNALGAAGMSGVSSLSNAMHRHHATLDDIVSAPTATDGCYNCHPGPTTKCLRDVMSQKEGMTCADCHGDMTKVSQNTTPWLKEPRCDTCHGEAVHQNQALYRNSQGHGGVYCAGCHDSPHAIAPSREAADGLKFVALQGEAGGLKKCTVCHVTQPESSRFQHSLTVRGFLPYVDNQP